MDELIINCVYFINLSTTIYYNMVLLLDFENDYIKSIVFMCPLIRVVVIIG
jgi:hypothetical protein